MAEADVYFKGPAPTGTGKNSNLPVSQANPLPVVSDGEYETVAASQTGQVLGPTGATGDYLNGLLITPASTSPGAVALLDGATSYTVFAGGASSVSNLAPFYVYIGARSVNGAWSVTTGASVSVLATGNFT
jgi:hypothetical protein